MGDLDVDEILFTIKNGNRVPEEKMYSLLNKLSEILFQESTLLTLELPINICGDIHGQLYDLFELFRVSGGEDNGRYLFLGDYVDRGYYSVETFAYLAALKVKYPDRIFLLRGNHEARDINGSYGLLSACMNGYGHSGVWTVLNATFDLLPLAALVGGEIFCVHGGLSPQLQSVEQCSLIRRDKEVPTEGPFCHLLWSDPEKGVTDWTPSTRGPGMLFGQTQADQFVQQNKLSLVARAHQMAMEGFEYHFDSECIVTVWSAPNYTYRCGNKATVLNISEDRRREFITFLAVPNDKRKIPTDSVSPYFA